MKFRIPQHSYKPQYLRQMKSDHHETSSEFEDWYPELIYIFRALACAHMHAQHVKTCMQLGQ